MGLTSAEWLLLGVGLGGLATTVSLLAWVVLGPRRPRPDPPAEARDLPKSTGQDGA
jgi:hypothetical protein